MSHLASPEGVTLAKAQIAPRQRLERLIAMRSNPSRPDTALKTTRHASRLDATRRTGGRPRLSPDGPDQPPMIEIDATGPGAKRKSKTQQGLRARSWSGRPVMGGVCQSVSRTALTSTNTRRIVRDRRRWHESGTRP